MNRIFVLVLICSMIFFPKTTSFGTNPIEKGCTTVIAVGNATKDGSILLAKNRDLSEFEVQWLYHIPRQDHTTETQPLELQYIEIPQSQITWGWVGSKSYTKKWGIGMGINEWGVSVGDNDASTREPLDGKNGLHDNDICRLILERSKTAYEGMKLTGELIEEYGHSYVGQIYSIADPNEVWVVECAGHHWAAIKIIDDIAVRANQFQITTHWDAGSEDLVEYAIEKGWCSSLEDFNFAECYSKNGYPYRSSQTRVDRILSLLEEKTGNIRREDMMEILSDHYEGTSMYKTAHDNSLYRTICNKRTVSSMVIHLQPSIPSENQVMWYCMSSPCISVYTPIFANMSKIPEPYITGEGPEDLTGYDPDSAWWVFKKLQLSIDENYEKLQPEVREEWNKLYNNTVNEFKDLQDQITELYPKDKREARNMMDTFSEEKLIESYTKAKEFIQEPSEEDDITENGDIVDEEETNDAIMFYISGTIAALIILIVIYLYLRRRSF